MAKPLYTFETFKGLGKQPWRFRIRHRNTQIVARDSEGYTTKRKRDATVRSMARAFDIPVEAV